MKLHRVPQVEQPELADTMRPYLAELAKIEGNEATSLDYSYLQLYWTESGREAYWLEEEGNRAGFALINRHAFVRSGAWNVSEFYVAPPWRRRGLGRQAACALFALHPGWWEIGILPGHIPALSFWTIVLEACSAVGLKQFEPGTVADWEGYLLVAEVPPNPALRLNGDNIGSNGTMAFVAPFGAIAAFDPGNQPWLDALWKLMSTAPTSTEPADTANVLGLLMVTGNWWQP